MYYMQKQAAQNRVINQFAHFIKSAGEDDYVWMRDGGGHKVHKDAFKPQEANKLKKKMESEYYTLKDGSRVHKDAFPGTFESLLTNIKQNPVSAGVGVGTGALAAFLAYRAARKRKASKLIAALAALGAGGLGTVGAYSGTKGLSSILSKDSTLPELDPKGSRSSGAPDIKVPEIFDDPVEPEYNPILTDW